MRRYILAVACILFSCLLSAQDFPKLKELSEREREEKIVPGERKGKWGYVNEKDNFRIKPVFDMAEEYRWTVLNGSDSISVAKVTFAGKMGVLNSLGMFLYYPVYDSISDFDRGVAIFTKDGGFGLMTAAGQVIIDALENIQPFDEYGLAWFRKDGRWGVFDLNGVPVFENRFDSVPQTRFGTLSLVSENGKMGFVSMPERSILVEPCADSVGVDLVDPEIVVYGSKGVCGAFHVNGTRLLYPEYEQITGMTNGNILVKKDGKFGLWDKAGAMIFPPWLYTNQIADEHAFYQIIDESTGKQELKVYYKEQVMPLSEFDNMMFQELSKARYAERIDEQYERFPYWLKGHLKEVFPATMIAGQWKFENTFYPYRQAARINDMESGIPEDGESYLKVGKDMKVKENEGFDFPQGNALNKASIMIDGTLVPCGTWLAPLFRSVNGAKIAEYDKQMGTRLFYDWQTISAYVSNKGFASDGDAVVVLDLMIDDLIMQKVIAKFSMAGDLKCSIKLDGILYDTQDYVNKADTRCFVTDDMVILSYSYAHGAVPKTSFYTIDGNVLTELDEFRSDRLLETTPVIRLFGHDTKNFTICSLDMVNRTYKKKGIGFTLSDTYVKSIGDHLYFYDKSTRLLESILNIGSDAMPVNALRYTSATWDGQRIVGLSVNKWVSVNDAKWMFAPKVTAGTFTGDMGGQLLTIYPVSEDGIASYSISPDKWSNEGIRYGYISYQDDFFTQALFDEVRPFKDGVAEVMIRGKWLRLTKADFVKYLNSPSEASSADNYLTGVQAFTPDQMKKADSAREQDMTNDDGYRLLRSYGGGLVAFENTYTGKYGFVDSTGVMLVPPIYDDYHECDFSVDRLVAVRKDMGQDVEETGWGFINMKGEVVVPCIYYRHWDDSIKSFFTPGEAGIAPMCRILSGGSKRMGCINRKGEIVIPFEYDSISMPVDGVMTAKLGVMTMKLKEDGTML